jgi:tetratricopeptide (TPR) repeat protein
LLKLERLPEAVLILEVLLETSPDRLDYLEALAEIMMKQGHFGRAAELLRHAYELSPGSMGLLEKLSGALLKVGNSRETLPYLEKLHQRRPADRALRNDLARLYYELGQYEKARALLIATANEEDADLPMLVITARVHDQLGLQNLAVEYWKKIVARQPDNLEGRDRLLKYYEQEGQGPETLEYLLALLEKNPEKAGVLKRVGQIYLGMTRLSEALPYFERYLALRSDDKEVLHLVVDLHSALGNKQKSIAALDRFFTLEPEPDRDNLLQAGKLYEAGGRYEDAVKVYERILKAGPDDTEILARLARALLAAGKEEAASDIWTRLARRQNLLEVLEELHTLEPSDQRVTQRLAFVYAEMGQLEKSRIMFEKLDREGNRNPEVLQARAELYERMGWTEHALETYEKLMAVSPGRTEAVLPMVRLAGQLGFVERLWLHWGKLGYETPAGSGERARIILAQALLDSGSFAEARRVYQTLLDEPPIDPEMEIAVLTGIAEAYRRSGLPYEAEESLREALSVKADDYGVLRRLFEFKLEEGRYEDAAVWLERVRDVADSYPDRGGAVASGKTVFPEVRLLRAKLLAAEGQYRHAVKLVELLLDDSVSSGEPGPEGLRLEAGISLCRFLLASGKTDEAEDHALLLQQQYPASLETSVLLSRIYLAGDDPGRAEEEIDRAAEQAAGDLGLRLRLVNLYRQQEEYSRMIQAAEGALHGNPESLLALLLLAEGFESAGQSDRAIQILRRVEQKYPDHFEARVKLTGLLMKSGRFAEAFDLGDELLAQERRADLLLIKARILWNRKKWDESLEIYQQYLTPPVEQLFVENCKELGIEPPPAEKRSIWEMVRSGKTGEKIFLDRVMTPAFAVGQDREAQLYTAAASTLYSRYSWQEHFNLELKGRRSVVRREYLAAVPYFEELVKKFPQDASLQFDLAGLYSRLGFLGKEEARYERIAGINAGYPGLSEARERNRLKLKPRSSINYGYRKEEGREGYKALRSEWQGLSFWLSPKSRQNLDLSLKRINYQATDIAREVKATRGELSYSASLAERLELTLGGGLESLDNGHPDAALVRCGLKAGVGNRINTKISFERDLMHDTTASLTRSITRHAFNAAASIDLVPGLSAGGQYTLIDYSDDNQTNGYDLWTSYLFFTDPVTLELKYQYDFKTSDQGRIPGPLQSDGFARDDHPYWSPQNYWQNRFSLAFKHRLSDEPYGRGVPSYYSAEYSVSYDSRGYAIQAWKGGIFFELTQHFMLEASAGITSSQEYRDRSISCFVVYRW